MSDPITRENYREKASRGFYLRTLSVAGLFLAAGLGLQAEGVRFTESNPVGELAFDTLLGALIGAVWGKRFSDRIHSGRPYPSQAYFDSAPGTL